ncbi:hypothetical protein TB2_033279 [Malus domestica]
MRRDMMGWNRSKDALGWKQEGRRRRRRCYNFMFHGCGTSRYRERVVSGSEVERKFTKTRSVEQRILPILGAPNVRRNASSHSILSRPRTKRYLRDWRNKMNVEFDIHSLSSFLILLQI